MAEVIKNVAESLEDLEILQPEENYVLVNGEPIYVKQFTFVGLLKALKHLSNLASLLTPSEDGSDPNFLEAFAKHGDDVLGLICLSTNKSKEFFENVSAEAGLDLAVLTYKVNEDFFVNSLLPKINALFPSDSPENEEQKSTEEAEVKPKAKKIGSTSSKN